MTRKEKTELCHEQKSNWKNRKQMAHISFIKLWESEICRIVGKIG